MKTETRLEMLESAIRIRFAENEIVRRYPEQKMRCPTHLCIGQEGPPVAVSQHLYKSDYVFSAHRSHGHYLAKSGNLSSMIAEIYGKKTGCARGKGGSQHLIDLDCGFMGSAPILASTISVGVGVAWAVKRRKEKKLVVIYFGDGATEEGTFHEAMNFAGVNSLPVLFVCENNLYSVHSTLEVRQPSSRSIWEIGKIHGVVGMAADGNNIDESWRVAGDAVTQIRAGGGPVIVEFSTYRWKEHCGPNEDESLGYRTSEEVLDWKERDPVACYEKVLVADGILSSSQLKKIRTRVQTEVDEAFAFAESSDFPADNELSDFVYPSVS